MLKFKDFIFLQGDILLAHGLKWKIYYNLISNLNVALELAFRQNFYSSACVELCFKLVSYLHLLRTHHLQSWFIFYFLQLCQNSGIIFHKLFILLLARQ